MEDPSSGVYKKGIKIRFSRGEENTFETMLKVDSIVRLGNGIHGLLGQGSEQFANQWFFVPGTSSIKWYIGNTLVVLPVKNSQPIGQLYLELEFATIKALQPAPA